MRVKFFTVFILILINASAFSQSALVKDIRLNDIAYHPGQDKIYAAISHEEINGNAIGIIHPSSGIIEKIIRVRFEPNRIEFNPDFTFLYIGYAGPNRLDRLSMDTEEVSPVAVLWDDLGTSSYNITRYPPQKVFELSNEGLSGDQIIMTASGEYSIFQEGIKLPNSAHNSKSTVELAFHASSNTLWSFESDSSNPRLKKMTIDENGLYGGDEFGDLGLGQGNIVLHGDHIFFPNGKVFNIANGYPEQVANVFDQVSESASIRSVVTLDKELGQVYLLAFGPNPHGYHLYTFDANDFSFIDRKSLHTTDIGYEKKMISTGAGGRLAMISSRTHVNSAIFPRGGILVILNGCEADELESLQIEADADIHCRNIPLTLSASGNYHSYQWNHSLGDQMGQTATFPVANSDLEAVVRAFDENGCLVAESLPFLIDNKVAGALSDTDPETLWKCASDTVELSVGQESADYFIWSTGDTATSIQVNQEGIYTVLAYKNPGCSNLKGKDFIIKHYESEIPQATFVDPGPFNQCPGEQVIVEIHDIGYDVDWNDQSSYSGHQRPYFSNQIISAHYIDEFGCLGPESDPVEITYFDEVPIPILSVQDSLVFTSAEGTKSWYFNGQLIPGENGDQIIAFAKGFYSIKVINDVGCESPFSQAVWMENPQIPDPVIIQGKVFADYDQNGIFNGDDVYLSNQWIQLDPLQYVTFTNQNGSFEFLESGGLYDLQILNNEDTWEVVLGSNGFAVNSLNAPDSVYQFTLYPKNFTPQVEVNIAVGITRCNMKTPVWLTINNKGAVPFDGSLCLKLGTGLEEVYQDNILLSHPPGEVCWNISNLKVGKQENIDLEILMPGVNQIGESVELEVQALDEEDNLLAKSNFNSILLCSYDPNDKLVFPLSGVNEEYSLLQDTLLYTIRFQNSGNDTAFIVRLTDTLSSDLNWNTFQPIAASHDYDLQFDVRDGFLEVTFDPILLPDSTIDFNGSQGYFSFQIALAPNLEEFSEVENSASIYFDFNPPIITNTTKVTVVSTFDADEDGYTFFEDCEDENSNINPGIEEIPYNGLDDDCDETTLDDDLDQDGFIAAEDCDDNNPAIHPDAIEIPNNDIDEDCDGEDLTNSIVYLEDIGFKIYPNPTNGELLVTASSTILTNVTLFDIQGNILIQFECPGTTKLDLSHYADGLYFIQLTTESDVAISRVVKHSK